MTTLQQRTASWYAARSGKLTASNLAGVLGLSTFCSRNETYDRIMGRTKFEGNSATEYGCANEQNGINAYQTMTGNLVEPTGLWVHGDNLWLAGSPDGLVGEDGIIEVKCPYYNKVPHKKIPLYYYVQIIACLEMTKRKWCDYISYTPNGTTIYRVHRDTELFDYLVPYWGQVYSCMQRAVQMLPELHADTKRAIKERVVQSMDASIEYSYYLNINLDTDLPDAFEETVSVKRQRDSSDD